MSTEAGLKYALYGGITAGIMLFGMSHIYGMVGSIQFSEIAIAMNTFEGPKLWITFSAFILFLLGKWNKQNLKEKLKKMHIRLWEHIQVLEHMQVHI